jgi:hypothetical protein
MTDDKTKTDARDRNRVARAQDYEVRFFAQEHGLSIKQARSLIAKFGSNRQVLEREAWKLTRWIGDWHRHVRSARQSSRPPL